MNLFIETNKRNPSRHRIEEHVHLNRLKANRKALNAGKMKAERVSLENFWNWRNRIRERINGSEEKETLRRRQGTEKGEKGSDDDAIYVI